jgi:hypothetical protein
MIELIWLILNTLLICFVVVKVFRLLKIIRERYGILISVICTFFLLSFVSKPNKTNQKTDFFSLKTENKNLDKNITYNSSYSEYIIVEDNLLSSINLFINYDKRGENREIIELNNCFTNRSGIITGTEFKMLDITIQKANTNSYDFIIIGKTDWSLVGITLYTAMEKYNGKITLK